MYGARARVGLLVPSSNTTAEMELFARLPAGVSLHVTRLFQRETDDPNEKIETILAMLERVDAASDELLSVEPAAIGYACTAGSFLRGADDDRATCSRLSARNKVPFVTASSAVANALLALGSRRVALATPYIDAVNEREREYLEAAAGVEVVALAGLAIVGNLPKGRLEPAVAAALAREVHRPEADAVFISCTNLRTMDVIAPLEQELGKPVISSNSALLWALLRAANIPDALDGCGHLLTLGPRHKENHNDTIY